MRSLFSLSLLAGFVFAAPGLRTVERYPGRVAKGSYIVTLAPGADLASSRLPASAGKITHTDWDPKILNGFAGEFTPEQLDALRARPDVLSIAEDGLLETYTVQTDASWGLGRLSSAGPLTGSITGNFSYAYYDAYQGQGVDIYVADTGVYLGHNEFLPTGRATWGWSATGLGTTDDQGHGTYVAGLAAGVRYGVAKKANVIAVKVFDASGAGSIANLVSGFTYILNAAQASKRPSVVVFAGGGGASTALDNAVVSLTNAGIHVVVAAGGSNTDVANTSPARVPSAVTVGASTFTDARASFSNYGPLVDIFAPGQNLPGPYIGSPNATVTLSGSSASVGYVAGLIALWISQNGNAPPATVSSSLWSVYGALSGIPAGTANRLAHGPITL